MKWEMRFCCRRCGDTFGGAIGDKDLIRRELGAYVAGVPFREPQCTERLAHQCKDGGVGVGELIGCQEL